MVAIICATFISGPFKPPSAWVSAAALVIWPLALNRRLPAIRAATPPMLAPTPAGRVARAGKRVG